jgi:hypothetical protein
MIHRPFFVMRLPEEIALGSLKNETIVLSSSERDLKSMLTRVLVTQTVSFAAGWPELGVRESQTNSLRYSTP